MNFQRVVAGIGFAYMITSVARTCHFAAIEVCVKH